MMTATAEHRTRSAPLADSTNARRLVDLVFRAREFGITAVLAIPMLTTASIQPRFLHLANVQFILVDATIFALLALGETMVVLTRNVDLSIGSVLGLSAFLSADLFGHHQGIPIAFVFVAGLAIGAACGFVNGFLTVVGRVPSLVVTLAMLYIIRGVDILRVGGGQVVATVVVGGVAIFGGSGSVVGAAFGALLLNTILSALYVLGVSPFWDQAIAGALLLSAIALDRGISLQLAAALRKRRTHLGA